MLRKLPRETTLLSSRARTRRNLKFIESAKEKDPQALAHVVTQITLSLLGIVVFPIEKLPLLSDVTETAKTIVTNLCAEGWLGWDITLDKPKKGKQPTKTLADLLRHLQKRCGPQWTDVRFRQRAS